MKQKLIDLFFKELDSRLQLNAQIILTGAACGSLMGHIRPSVDIDFEITPEDKAISWELIDQILRDLGCQFSIGVQYSSDISKWSMIDYLDYKKTKIKYKTFGSIDVYLIAPKYWTIGKMGRYLASDENDVAKIIKAQNILSDEIIQIWAKATKSSDLSLELGMFKDHVLHFLNVYTKKLWGKTFEPGELISKYKQMADIKT